jgi:hypothetical protein
MLTEAQWKTLRAAIDRIIPADDYPGGWDAGVGEYFARLLACESRFLPEYQAGLDALGHEAEVVGKTFAAMTAEAQDALLANIEAGWVRANWLVDPAAFFRLLVEQTLEGFYADPGNGGNLDGIAWQMIGYQVTA